MAAWGVGVFENDDAHLWMNLLVDQNDLKKIKETLKTASEYSESDYLSSLEEPYGSEALAAAETVAILKGTMSDDVPTQLIDWIEDKKENIEELTELAMEAIQVVEINSEIKQIWMENEEYDFWRETLNDLRDRLTVCVSK